ncbi:type III-B CRISPR module-associated protein Cmr5 [Skermanella sp. TT6]|uniref:CRISPR type III-B/RAMP module-associated protein Cmr5 n=1 Tax=Skermanella cutis TaxID=2775420 RepID=A0ABX7BCQ6_9PROT|nr:type III-B CRISPR module-associated protein Cmr5 [Skermanella sp. TT6]QQP92188.1 type III-B CRISPR module-associated protein Cmr5 [Skermanella sp. TT6]
MKPTNKGRDARNPSQAPPAGRQEPPRRKSLEQSLDQRRAAHAWNAVQEMGKSPDAKAAGDFAGHAKKLPMRIRAAGLGQALAFVAAKAKARDAKNAKPGLVALLETLNCWVLDQRELRTTSAGDDPHALIQEITSRDSAFLKRATAETMSYLLWLNRFAEAEGLRGSDEDAA